MRLQGMMKHYPETVKNGHARVAELTCGQTHRTKPVNAQDAAHREAAHAFVMQGIGRWRAGDYRQPATALSTQSSQGII
jgi:hypothetical protein